MRKMSDREKERYEDLFRFCHIMFALIFVGGLFFMLGFIGNVDYCTEMGIECEVGFPHLLGSALLMIFGFVGYKVTTYLQRGTFNRYD